MPDSHMKNVFPHMRNHVGKYSKGELNQLHQLRKQLGNDWQKMGLLWDVLPHQ